MGGPPDFPLMNTVTGPLRKASAGAGSPDFVALWSGQAVGLNRQSAAAELVETLVEETRAAMARLAGSPARPLDMANQTG